MAAHTPNRASIRRDQRDQRRKDKRRSQAQMKAKNDRQKTIRKRDRQKTIRGLGKGIGGFLSSSQDFAHSQAQQVRDRGAQSQAHIQETAPGLVGAYLGMPSSSPTGSTVATSAGLPSWTIPVGVAGGAGLYFLTRKKGRK